MFLLFFCAYTTSVCLVFICENCVLSRYIRQIIDVKSPLFAHMQYIMESHTHTWAWHGFQCWKLLWVYISTSTVTHHFQRDITYFMFSSVLLSLHCFLVCLNSVHYNPLVAERSLWCQEFWIHNGKLAILLTLLKKEIWQNGLFFSLTLKLRQCSAFLVQFPSTLVTVSSHVNSLRSCCLKKIKIN